MLSIPICIQAKRHHLNPCYRAANDVRERRLCGIPPIQSHECAPNSAHPLPGSHQCIGSPLYLVGEVSTRSLMIYIEYHASSASGMLPPEASAGTGGN